MLSSRCPLLISLSESVSMINTLQNVNIHVRHSNSCPLKWVLWYINYLRATSMHSVCVCVHLHTVYVVSRLHLYLINYSRFSILMVKGDKQPNS